jgi:hypothetical protein
MNSPPTCAELHQAYEAMAVRSADLRCLSFTEAMQHPTWARVIDCRARAQRTAQYKAATTRRVQLVRRFNPSTGTWHTQRVPGVFDDQQPQFS